MTQLEKVEFQGAFGDRLAARLESPDGPVKAYALFAHCFACSKDTLAAARIAAALAERGIGVLRFDFTGLGQSGGDFADTHFSSNVADLKAAADWLRRNRAAPTLLIGHSLGGAASIVAALDIPEVKAVATIGAPASAAHAEHNFAERVSEIEREGEAEVRLGGRSFRVRRSFLDDIRAQKVEEAAARLKRALLILHAPLDEVVGIENATRLFAAARHPKSFVSLDQADDLLRRREDALFVADMVAAWASSVVPDGGGIEPVAAPARRDASVAEETGLARLQNMIAIGDHRFLADEPPALGGQDSGPSPYELVRAGLAACTSMTVRLYADRKNWPLQKVRVEVVHSKEKAGADEPLRDRFVRKLRLEGALDAEQRQKLLEIAQKCPVHRTLEAGAVVETEPLED